MFVVIAAPEERLCCDPVLADQKQEDWYLLSDLSDACVSDKLFRQSERSEKLDPVLFFLGQKVQGMGGFLINFPDWSDVLLIAPSAAWCDWCHCPLPAGKWCNCSLLCIPLTVYEVVSYVRSPLVFPGDWNENNSYMIWCRSQKPRLWCLWIVPCCALT